MKVACIYIKEGFEDWTDTQAVFCSHCVGDSSDSENCYSGALLIPGRKVHKKKQAAPAHSKYHSQWKVILMYSLYFLIRILARR